jgi:hypothetical protein
VNSFWLFFFLVVAEIFMACCPGVALVQAAAYQVGR